MHVKFNNCKLKFSRSPVELPFGVFIANHCYGGFDDTVLDFSGRWIMAKGGLKIFLDRNLNVLMLINPKKFCYLSTEMSSAIIKSGAYADDFVSRYTANENIRVSTFRNFECLHCYE